MVAWFVCGSLTARSATHPAHTVVPRHFECHVNLPPVSQSVEAGSHRERGEGRQRSAAVDCVCRLKVAIIIGYSFQ